MAQSPVHPHIAYAVGKPKTGLTPKAVREIRRDARVMTRRTLAFKYNASKGTISSIVDGLAWKHVK